MKFHAVIFDLDGTLLNTLADLASAHNRVLAELGLPGHATDRYRDFIGNGARKCIERSLPEEHRNSDLIERGLLIQKREYARNWHEQTRPYQGVEVLLERLRHKGVNLAVLSNKDDSFPQQCLAFFFPHKTFDIIQGFTEEIPPKPNPKGALILADHLKLAPREILFVGDSEVDMETAVAAGMYPAGALWGFRSERKLLSAGARCTLEQPLELLRLF